MAEGEGEGGRAGAGGEDLLRERVEEQEVGVPELQEGRRVGNGLSLLPALSLWVFDKSRRDGTGGGKGGGG